MPGFVEITAEDVLVMRDGGGARFTLFLDSLIRATAARLGLSPTAIHTTVRVTIPDGGVDTQVDEDGHDPTWRLTPKTAWQFKAVPYASVSDAVIREEVGKPHAKSLIENGYGYRLCICDDPPAQIKTEKLGTLSAALRLIRADAPEPLILTVSDLVDWANQYTAVVAKCRRIATTDFLFFDSWSRQATAVTRTFVGTAGSATVARAVREHLDFSQRPSQVALTIYGEAGVGKTRSVHEAIRVLENHRELAAYTRDEAIARKIAVGLANDGSANAILIADECVPQTLHALQETLRGAEGRVRVITIDNAQERRSLNPQLELTELTEAEVEGVLAANYPNVAAENRRRYAHLSSGFLRIAADLCSRDQEILARGDIAPALNTIAQYYETRLDNREDYAAVEALSLVDRAGYQFDIANELDLLCALAQLNRSDVEGRLERIRIAPGFVVNAGRYYYVTPAVIAMIAFQAAWDRWASRDPEGFLRRIPEGLVLPFQRRVSRSASAEVSAIVANFFRQRTESLGAGAIGAESEARRLLALIEADPSTYVPILRRAVEQIALPPGDGSLTPQIRRQIIWIAERAAIFPDFFADVEQILYVLATHETEPSIGNNATKTWQSLFAILLSGSSLPVAERLGFLRQRFRDGDTATKLLVIGAVRMALGQGNVKILGPPMFGRRVPPEEWRPRTQDEYRSSLSAFLTFLAGMLSGEDPDVNKAAEDALVSEATYIARNGGLDLVARAVPADTIREDLRARLLAALDDALEGANRFGRPVPALDEPTAAWMKSLKPHTLHGRLVEELTPNPWSHRYDDDDWRRRLDALAQEVLSSDEAFESELTWLNSSDARAAGEFGHAVGKRDVVSLSKLDVILSNALESRSHAFARGYVYAVCQSPALDANKLNDAIDRLENANAELAFFIAAPGGDITHAFERGLTSVRTGRFRPGILQNLTVWIGSRRTGRAEARTAVEVLVPIAEHTADSDAVDTAIDFITYRIHGLKDRLAALEELRATFDDPALRIVWRLVHIAIRVPGRESFWLTEILKVIAESDPVATCDVIAQMLVSDEYSYSESAESLCSELGPLYPRELMNAIGQVMLNNPRFYIGKFNFLATLPFDVVKEWLRENGVSGARPLARHLIAPSIDQHGMPILHPLTECVLREFEADDRTFREFVAGTHSFQTYVGSYAEARTRERAVARAFLNHPLRRVREWASVELQQAEHEARVSSIEEQEMNLD